MHFVERFSVLHQHKTLTMCMHNYTCIYLYADKLIRKKPHNSYSKILYWYSKMYFTQQGLNLNLLCGGQWYYPQVNINGCP